MSDPATIPTEQLLQMTDDPQGPGVYVLDLDSPGTSCHAHARRWYDELQTAHPPDVPSLAGTDRLLYVGATAHLQDRLEDHVRGDVRRSTWLSVYPPVSLHAVYPARSATRAFEVETTRAYDLAADTPETTAVICDGEVVG